MVANRKIFIKFRAIFLLAVLFVVFTAKSAHATSNFAPDRTPSGGQAFFPIIDNGPAVVITDIHGSSEPTGAVKRIYSITNESNIPVYDVVLGLTVVYSGTTTEVDISRPAVITATLPGATTYASYTFMPEDVDIVRYYVKSARYSDPNTYATATIDDIEIFGIGICDVTVTITNDNPFPLKNVIGFAHAWSSGNALVTIDVTDYLDIGETIQFQHSLIWLDPFDTVFAYAIGAVGP